MTKPRKRPKQTKPKPLQCQARRRGWRCVLSNGHKGKHVEYSGFKWSTPKPKPSFDLAKARRKVEALKYTYMGSGYREGFNRALDKVLDEVLVAKGKS